MQKIVVALAGATALAISSAAGAAVTLDDCTMVCDGPTTLNGTTEIGYSEAGLSDPFTESLTFTNDLAGLYNITLDTSSAGVDFASAILSGPDGPFNLVEEFDNGFVEFWALSNLILDAGQYTLTIMGSNSATGSLAGTITINQAIPEPGTWAMMLLGFGTAGYAMRRRRRGARIPQIA